MMKSNKKTTRDTPYQAGQHSFLCARFHSDEQSRLMENGAKAAASEK